jgi:hypothetical protein
MAHSRFNRKVAPTGNLFTTSPRPPRRAPLESPQEATRIAEMAVTVAGGCFLTGLSQPAESQD